jgi:GAF domain-containing protein
VERETVLTTIQEIVVNLIGSEEVAIFEFAEDGGEFRLASSFGVDLSRLKSFKAGSGPIAQRLLGGEVFVNDHVSGGEDKLTACIPLRIGEQLIGAILVFRLLEHKQGLQPLDHELFELLGVHASTALYCANLHNVTAAAVR